VLLDVMKWLSMIKCHKGKRVLPGVDAYVIEQSRRPEMSNWFLATFLVKGDKQ
jgi:hypothetical protein